MELSEAKDIVRQLYCGSFEATMKLPNTHLHGEAIRLVCEAACDGDEEARGVQTCIPREMSYMGLYPHIMEPSDIKPDVRPTPDGIITNMKDVFEKLVFNYIKTLDQYKFTASIEDVKFIKNKEGTPVSITFTSKSNPREDGMPEILFNNAISIHEYRDFCAYPKEVLKAKQYAFEKHDKPSDCQRYGKAPYSKHLLDVKDVGERYKHLLSKEDIPIVMCSILLHDTVEDTDTTPNKLKKEFSNRIASIVLAVSNERGWDKKEILFKTLPKIWKDDLAIFVKLCDRIANTMNSKNGYDEKSKGLFQRYSDEYPVFRYALKNKLYSAMWEELDNLYEYNGLNNKTYESND